MPRRARAPHPISSFESGSTGLSPSSAFQVREFARSRWHDFEELFGKYGGVQAGCWCMFYHRAGPNGPLESGSRQNENRRDHHALLLGGHAHGVLVYRGDVPIGWCQFGRRADLPRVENGRKYRALAGELPEAPDWRITCFFVDRPHRRSGVAKAALGGALRSIAKRGGGIVEAYPSTDPHAVATWFGSLTMFRAEGFRVVRPFGRSNVLMQKRVAATSRS